MHARKEINHNGDHHIKNKKHIDNKVHPFSVTSPSLGVKRVEASSLNVANDDDVYGMFFVITRTNSLSLSGVSLHDTFSLQEISLKWVLL